MSLLELPRRELSVVVQSWVSRGWLTCALALLPSWLGLLGDWSWRLDLLAHFRWQYLIVAAAVLAWSVWRRWRVLAALALLTLLLNIVLIGRFAWQPDVRHAVLAPDFQLRLLSMNVQASNADTRAVTSHVLASGADVAVFLEVDAKWAAALQALEAQFPYRSVHPEAGNFGIALYSRIPFSEPELLSLGGAQVPTIAARMAHQGREFLVIGTHPVPPISQGMTALRDEQLRLLADYVSRSQVPVLLAGDLNTTPWSAGMRMLTAGGLGFRGRDAPWMPTWLVRSPFAIPIDHVLCTAPLVITRRRVGPDVGSDHRPISVEVGWAL